MKHFCCFISALILTFLTVSARPEAAVTLRPVSVTASRTADVGSSVTPIDSAALHESVALSLAEVLGFNTSVFVKNYGRASVATISFRGSSPSHTAVTWNGIKITSPMIGTSDFSMIPSYFVDKAALVHGSASIPEIGGGLGGLVRLSSDSRDLSPGFSGQFVQGIGSWKTVDDFLKLNFSGKKFSATVRTSFASSANDFPFTNYDKKENVYDDNHNIVYSYHPRERNRSGAYKDFNILGSFAFDGDRAGRWRLNTWYLSSNRQLPLLTTDYSSSNLKFENRQREQTLRTVADWQKSFERHTLTARAGYIHSWIAYDYWRQIGPDVFSVLAKDRNRINTFYGAFAWRFFPTPKWFFSFSSDIYHNEVESRDFITNNPLPTGYKKGRIEWSGVATAKWRPSSRVGLALTVREDIVGKDVSAPVPAFFADFVIWKKAALTARASVSRNYHFPSLSDLYTIPGGNADLRPEKGFNYDAGLSSKIKFGASGAVALNANWFDSYITDWIQWLPSPRGFYVPENFRKVHSCGVECQGAAEWRSPGSAWAFSVALNYSYTSSINKTPPRNSDDKSFDKQLPYVPLHSGSASVRAAWKNIAVVYRIQAYSERFTMSSNEYSIAGHLPPYSVSNVSVECPFSFLKLDWLPKIAVNNLFNAEYQTVLSRPMPGINFEFFLSLSW